MKSVMSCALAIACLALSAFAGGFDSKGCDPAITLSVVDGPDPFGVTITVSITDGVDPIPTVAVFGKATILEDSDPLGKVLVQLTFFVEGADPVGIEFVLGSIIDLPDPIS